MLNRKRSRPLHQLIKRFHVLNALKLMTTIVFLKFQNYQKLPLPRRKAQEEHHVSKSMDISKEPKFSMAFTCT